MALSDKPENILERIAFYNVDSKPIQKTLTAKDSSYLLKEIKKDITYFHASYRRAHLHAYIGGSNAELAAHRIRPHISRPSAKDS